MPDPKTQAWDFGDTNSGSQEDLPRNDLLQKTREATSAVGYAPQPELTRHKSQPQSKKPKLGKVTQRGRPRKSRTIPLSTKITPEHDALVKAIAAEGFVIADIVGEALTVFSRELARSRQYKRFPLDDATIAKASAVADKSE